MAEAREWKPQPCASCQLQREVAGGAGGTPRGFVNLFKWSANKRVRCTSQLAKIDELEVNLAKRTNAAFVFVKPHACNDKVCQLAWAAIFFYSARQAPK
jgi:hypothetical protein